MDRDTLRRVFRRELATLAIELDLYQNDAQLWELPEGLSNSAGTLSLHVCGNLRHFVGAKLGNSGYLRDREAEFARRDLSRVELAETIGQCVAEVDRTLTRLDDETMHSAYPLSFEQGELEVQAFLLHLATHLAYHLGQIDLHRRVVTRHAGTISALNFDGLFADLGEAPGQES